MSETSLSQEAHDRLQAELKHLTTEGRVDVANRIEAARALGDLSENGDYHAAKDDQGKMEARIRHLQATLADAEIVDHAEVGDEVVVGAVVTIRYEGDEETERYLVGSIEEKRDDVELTSPTSPLGAALVGSKIGDVVEYEVPSGARLKVEIVDVSA